jgi:RHS repeat-associated protein
VLLTGEEDLMGRMPSTYVLRVALALVTIAVPGTVHADGDVWITYIDPGHVTNGGVVSWTSLPAIDIHWDYNPGAFTEILDTRVCVNGRASNHCYSAMGEWNPLTIELDQLMGGGCAPVLTLEIYGSFGASGRTRYSIPFQVYVTEGPSGSTCVPEPKTCEQEVGGPIDVATGRMWYGNADLRLGGAFPIALERSYRSDREDDGPLGVGWRHSYMTRLEIGSGWYNLHDPEGRVIPFGLAGPPSAVAPAPNRHARLSLASITGGYRLTDPVSVTTYDFDSAGKLTAITNRDGLTQTLIYSGGLLQNVADPHGRTLTFAYTNNRLDSVTANPGGIVVDYTVNNTQARLESVADPLGQAEVYAYTDPYDTHNLTAVTDPLGHLVEEHTYNASGRVTDFTRADDVGKLHLDYSSETETTVTSYISMSPPETASSTYSYDPVWKVVTAIAGPACECNGGDESRSFTWDTWLNKLTETDGLGRVTKYEYYTFTDGEPVGSGSSYTRGTVKAMTEAFGTPDARTTTFHYGSGDAGFHLTQMVRASVADPGRTATTTYDLDAASKRVLHEIRSGWLEPGVSATYTTALTYQFGQVATVDGPRTDVADVTSMTFYPASAPSIFDRGLPYQRIDAVGNTSTYQSYNIFGQPTVVVDPNGVVTTFVFDDKGRLETTTIQGTPPYTTTTMYDTADRLTDVVKPAGNRVAYAYDDANRLLTTTLEDASANERERVLTVYDLRGLRRSEEAQRCETPAAPCTTWTTKRSESFVYDDYGRLAQTIHPDTTFVEHGYDEAGNLTSIKDEAHTNPNTIYGYDSFNRLVTVTQALDEDTITTTYVYDEHDNLTSVTDPEGNLTVYTPDDFRRTRVVASAATGTTTYTNDPAGNVKTITRSSGRAIGRMYDAANRLVEETAGGEPLKLWVWDQGTYGRGRLSSAGRHNQDDKLFKTYAYDRRGNVVQLETEYGEVWHQLTFAYDANGNESSISLEDGSSVDVQLSFQYDPSDRVTSATADGVTWFMRNATHRPFGPIVSYRFGSELPMATVLRDYDQRYRLHQLSVSQTGYGTVLNRTYSYADGLNLTGWTDSRNLSLDYDDLSRLRLASDSLGTTWSFTYDTIGNRRAKTVTGPSPESWAYHYLPNGTSHNTPLLEEQIDSTRTMPVVHDADGAVTELRQETGEGGSDLIVSMGYTQDMTLEAHTEEGVASTYRYDTDGYLVRVLRQDDSEYQDARLVYDHRGRLLAILHNEAWQEQNRTFVYADGQPIGLILGTPESQTVHEIVSDHLGTPVIYFRDTAHYARIWYSPFGELTDVEEVGGGAPPIDLRFPGQLDLTSTVSNWPTYYNIHRWYLPDWGRYTQADPVGLSRSFNLFGYARQNPLQFSDPFGLYEIDSSCDRCPWEPTDNIPREIGVAGRYLENPDCQRALAQAGSGVLACMLGRFGPDQNGSGPLIKCQKNPPGSDACGEYTDPVFDVPPTIHLYSGREGCPRRSPGIGIAPTIFHEAIHSCGVPAAQESQVIGITSTCSGYN